MREWRGIKWLWVCWGNSKIGCDTRCFIYHPSHLFQFSPENTLQFILYFRQQNHDKLVCSFFNTLSSSSFDHDWRIYCLNFCCVFTFLPQNYMVNDWECIRTIDVGEGERLVAISWIDTGIKVHVTHADPSVKLGQGNACRYDRQIQVIC